MSRIETIGDCTPGTFIYALCEPDTWEPRYVGKTVQPPHRRYLGHMTDARRGRRLPVHYWLRKQDAAGRPFAIEILEYVAPGDDWIARERHWIAALRSPRLLNLGAGGEGLAGHTLSPDHKAKIAEALRSGSTFACERCGETFYRKRNEIERGHTRFCSRICSNRRDAA